MSKSIDEKIDSDLAKVNKTEFGQSPGESKVKHPEGDETRPSTDSK